MRARVIHRVATLAFWIGCVAKYFQTDSVEWLQLAALMWIYEELWESRDA